MQKLDMSSYGVEELDANKMKDLDGGFLITGGALFTIPAVGIMLTIATGIILIGGAIGTGLIMANSAIGDLLA